MKRTPRCTTRITESYYAEDVAGPAAKAAPIICEEILRDLRPSSVIDVGCGSGEFLDEFRRRGVEGHGVELAAAALARCRAKGLDVARVDLTTCRELPWRADLVYSFEVAEHIAKAAAPRFVGTITGAAIRHAVLTAAPPGQVGLCHVNCQPKSYWVSLFDAAGFRFDDELTGRWSELNRLHGLPGWFCANLMVFHRA